MALLAREPRAERAQRLGPRAHHAELAVDALLDQAGVLQHLQMARDRGRRDAEGLGDLADGQVAAGEQALDDRAPRRIGEGGEDVVEVGCAGIVRVC